MRVLALLLTGACGGEGDFVSVDTPEKSEDFGEPDLSLLAAVGYSDWDEQAGSYENGVVRLDRERAQPGLTLFTDEVNRVFAIDLEGGIVHEWTVPGRAQVTHAHPLGDGRVIAVSVDEGVTLVDAVSDVVWARDLNAHHDVAALADGTFMVPVWNEHEYRARRVRFDLLVHLSADGEVLGEWDSHAHLEALQALHPPLVLDTAPPPTDDESDTIYDYYHLNTVVELPDTKLGGDLRFRAGNLLLCFRNANLIVILDGDTFEVTWSWPSRHARHASHAGTAERGHAADLRQWTSSGVDPAARD